MLRIDVDLSDHEQDERGTNKKVFACDDFITIFLSSVLIYNGISRNMEALTSIFCCLKKLVK